MKISLSEVFTYRLSAKQRDFYARVLSGLTRVERRGFGTIAVGISNDGRHVLYVDPEFLERLSFPELLLTMEHEVLHIILGHIPRFVDIISGLVLKEEIQKFRAAMNISADLAANELIRAAHDFDKTQGPWFYGSELTEGRSFLIPETFKLKRRQPFEVYLLQMIAKMRKNTEAFTKSCQDDVSVPMPEQGQPEQGQPGQGQPEQGQPEQGQPGQGQPGPGSNDPTQQTPENLATTYFNQRTGNRHRFWEHGAGEKRGNSEELQGLADKLRQEGRDLIRTAVREHLKSRGTIPHSLREHINRLLATPSIPWPRVLRSLCTRTQQSKRQRGMRRPSRRLYGVPGILPFPGSSQDFRFTIAFAVDTSGSMNVKALSLALRELLNIVKTEPDVTLTVMYCDATLQVTYKVEREEDVDFTVRGRGGTDFNPVFVKVRELLKGDSAPDILVYATDLYAPAPAVENRVPIPVIWLTTPGASVPSDGYGICIKMEPFS